MTADLPGAPGSAAATAGGRGSSTGLRGSGSGLRGTLVLEPSACTSCMLCVRECPVWCLHLESHQEPDPASPSARRPRVVNVLDSFEVDYGLCMYCGICVQVCPFDALAWAASPTPPETSAAALRHGTDRLAPGAG